MTCVNMALRTVLLIYGSLPNWLVTAESTNRLHLKQDLTHSGTIGILCMILAHILEGTGSGSELI